MYEMYGIRRAAIKNNFNFFSSLFLNYVQQITVKYVCVCVFLVCSMLNTKQKQQNIKIEIIFN